MSARDAQNVQETPVAPGTPPARPVGRGRPRGEFRLTLALWIGLLMTLVPLTRVVAPGSWIPGAAALSAALLALGFLLRRLRVPAVGVTLSLLAAWTAVITGAFFSADALFAVIPTGAVFGEAARLVEVASAEIFVGVAPLPVSPALAFVIVAALSLLAVALDHVVLTARMPLLAGIALVSVWLIPAIAVPAGVDVIAFALLAASVLYLIRAETRTRESAATAARSGGVTAVAMTIGAVAIVGALVAGPVLPAPVAGAGTGVAASIDPTLNLGADLRRRSDVPVLTMHGDATTLPYLRVATLSQFDGQVWMPDRTRSVALPDGLEPLVVAPDVAVTERRTSISVSALSSSALPVPYAAVEITGIDDTWRTSPYSRTVLSGRSSAQGQNYEVLSQQATPTLEQIQSTRAATAESSIDVTSLPEDTPAVIGELAAQVTAGAGSDYDKLLALQSWFRGPEFAYSLDAPVEDGFDDQGTLAVAEFLEVKKGYCVHFAGAFALMARALDMPSRIVVGFLPGDLTGESVDGEPVSQVTTSQLHAWPEVYFEGIGWVAFEPTKSLGTPTRFASAADTPVGSGADPERPTDAASPAPSSTGGPADRPDQGSVDASGPAVRVIDLRPLLTVVGAVLVIALLPGAAGAFRRWLLRRRGTAGAAWRYLQDTAIDLGVSVSASETPRAFGTRLSAVADAPPTETARLVGAVERESYGGDRARDRGTRGTEARRAMADAVAIRQAMLAALPPAARVRAIAVPRSLVIRPGSAFADRDAPA